MKNKISNETQAQAIKLAKGTQKKALNKEQTKLVTQGIEKGIAEYKKQQSIKAREMDKQRKQKAKQQLKAKPAPESTTKESKRQWLAWFLLLVSWSGFIVYAFFKQKS